MPAKKPLVKRFIQDAVAERLNREYYRRKPAYESTEVYTKLKRADVLLAFMRAPGRPYVVVVEAKSRTTIHQLKLKKNEQKVRWTGRIIALLLIVGLSAVLGYQWYLNALNTLLLLALFLIGAAGISALISRLELRTLSSISAIEQLGRYPANESWIAVGDDTFVNPAQYRSLRLQCAKNGVGLIVVDQKGRLSLKEKPRPRHVFNNYLGKYGKEETILKKIDRNPDYGPTPPERAKRRRQMARAAVLLAGVGILGLMGYEQSYGPVVTDPFAASLPGSSEGVEISDAPADLPTDPFGEAALPDVLPTVNNNCGSLDVDYAAFIVVDAVLPPREAQRRANQLSVAGLRDHEVVGVNCLHNGGPEGQSVVYTGTLYPYQPAARRAAAQYEELLIGLGLPAVDASVVKIYPGG